MDSIQETTATAPAEGDSSFLSSPSSSMLSSPLSSPGTTPSPPPEIARIIAQLHTVPYPSPPASQQTTPPPDGMSSTSTSDKEGPPPAKRRRISKERSTEYLDLRSSDVDPDQQPKLDQLLNVLHKRQKIVVVAGAGISVSAGIPDFRSANGLFRSLKDEHKLKGSGKDLFDASVYKDDTSTSSFHDMVSSMSRLTKDAKPTPFHHMLATIASEDRLLRLYSQNVDGIDTALEPLKTSVPLRKDENGKWPRTVQLHGNVDKMVCSKCHQIFDLDADLFSGPTPPACPNCEEFNSIRVNHEGKRSHGIGRLRPRMVLYNEANPDDKAIGSVTSEDLRKRPDAVIVAGTTLKVPGVKRIVREMCKTVRDRRGGVAIWINTDLPPAVKEFEDCFDIIVQGTCDEVASRAAMRKWNQPLEQDECSQVSEDDAKKAIARSAEVHLPKCELIEASPEPLPSDLHLNNSFPPPPSHMTPRKPLSSPLDWTPMTCRIPSIISSIEGDTQAVNTSGLLTPSKVQKTSTENGIAPLSLSLKDGGKPKKPVGRPSKAATAGNAKKPTIKSVKLPKAKAAASKAHTGPKAILLTNTFKQTKAAESSTQATKKFLPSPAKSPSKPLIGANMPPPTHPMHQLAPQDPRNNTSPSKAKVLFPNLLSENDGQQGHIKRMSIADIVN